MHYESAGSARTARKAFRKVQLGANFRKAITRSNPNSPVAVGSRDRGLIVAPFVYVCPRLSRELCALCTCSLHQSTLKGKQEVYRFAPLSVRGSVAQTFVQDTGRNRDETRTAAMRYQ